MTTPQAAALTDALRDLHMSCGEIITGYHAAQFIRDHETDNGLEFTPQEILRALRESGEQFVDSMQENEMDTESCVKDGLYYGHPIDPLETRLSRWEAMRPSTIRLAAIAEITTAAAELESITTAAAETHLAIFAATLNAPKTPEFERLREINRTLADAITRAKNQIAITH